MKTPLAERLQIVLVGKTNAGKSSLFNLILGKPAAVVSAESGTTTDPVTRTMELLPIGPVAFTDTAGFGDKTPLGRMRTAKTKERIEAADIILFVSASHLPPDDEEEALWHTVTAEGKPCLLVLTFADKPLHVRKAAWRERRPVSVDVQSGRGLDALIERLQDLSRLIEPEPGPLEGLVQGGDHVLLVAPIDSAAPKGRLILPEAETIRDALDRGCAVTVATDQQLAAAYACLVQRPALVVTDSQAFGRVSGVLPADQPLTSFSILFARKKGGLRPMIEGLRALKDMKPGAHIIIIEACTHHRQKDDIATAKIPHLFRRLVRPDAQFSVIRGLPTEEELVGVDLVLHCGGCMLSRGRMRSRLAAIGRAGVPVLNFGLFLAWSEGLIPRALLPLPEYRHAIGHHLPFKEAGAERGDSVMLL